MEKARYIIGIDLGTTHCVVAYTDAEVTDTSDITIFKIPQLTGSAALEYWETLPSFLYMGEEHELGRQAEILPWSHAGGEVVVGEYARQRGCEVPQKLISSSKSWLCNPYIDRESSILPWQGPDSLGKLSPVQASCSLLNHIKNAWNYQMAQGDDTLKFENQELHLTVPASFDAVARQLTVKAAKLAGLGDITLIEEPQAAFYSWIDKSGDSWRDQVNMGDLVLVCDVGGGTSDFSLIEVKENPGGTLGLERLAVGDHLLVGGDNIDLSLAYFLSHQLKQQGKSLDDWQMRGLVQSCRKAKEDLFSDKGVRSCPVTILGRGSGLIKGTIKAALEYSDIETIVLDGFFPKCRLEDRPASTTSSGMKEVGLPYESDPGITRHLARFISSLKDDAGNVRLPTAIVFNGGVMKSDLLRRRVTQTVSLWKESAGEEPIREIGAHDFFLSVARGAAYFGMAAKGEGVRIRGGLANTYYMAVEAAMPAVPGMVPPTRALCIAPFGMEEGSDALCRDRLFNLVVGETVKFDIMTSSVRHDDALGAIVDGWEEKEIRPLTSIETTLEGEETVIPVTFKVKLTEIGTLEFWALSRDDDKKWNLELNVRPRSE